MRRVRLPGGHVHTSEELERELIGAGLSDVEVVRIEGPAGLALEKVAVDDQLLAAALVLARSAENVPGIRDFSNHILAIGRVP